MGEEPRVRRRLNLHLSACVRIMLHFIIFCPHDKLNLFLRCILFIDCKNLLDVPQGKRNNRRRFLWLDVALPKAEGKSRSRRSVFTNVLGTSRTHCSLQYH